MTPSSRGSRHQARNTVINAGKARPTATDKPYQPLPRKIVRSGDFSSFLLSVVISSMNRGTTLVLRAYDAQTELFLFARISMSGYRSPCRDTARRLRLPTNPPIGFQPTQDA